MRITYVSLPSADDSDAERYASPPLAAGYLASFARQVRGGKDFHTLLDPVLLFGKNTDEITEIIHASNPQLVALSVYNWNRDEAMAVSRSLRAADAGLPIVLGGPEVAFAPQPALLESGAWWVCTGEGEIAFVSLLNLLDDGAGRYAQPAGMVSRFTSADADHAPALLADPLDSIPSPYEASMLKPRPGGTADLETMRGCPFNCNFCLYGKNYSHPRYFSLARVRSDLSILINSEAASIYIIDPTFNLPSKRCLEICGLLKELNHQHGKKIFVEVKAEFINERMADAFVEAGITAVEIGLQSINTEALALMGRGFDPAAFTRGMLLLRERGIWANVGVIAGLPGDTLEQFEQTLRFVSDQGLGRLLIYPLQIFPGSMFHGNAERLGLKFEPAPSYRVTETRQISAKKMKDTIDSIPHLIEKMNQHYLREMSRQVLEKLRDLQRVGFDKPGHPDSSLI